MTISKNVSLLRHYNQRNSVKPNATKHKTDMTWATKRDMAGRTWPADRQFDTPGVCDCAVHLKNSVQYASILQ